MILSNDSGYLYFEYFDWFCRHSMGFMNTHWARYYIVPISVITYAGHQTNVLKCVETIYKMEIAHITVCVIPLKQASSNFVQNQYHFLVRFNKINQIQWHIFLIATLNPLFMYVHLSLLRTVQFLLLYIGMTDYCPVYDLFGRRIQMDISTLCNPSNHSQRVYESSDIFFCKI